MDAATLKQKAYIRGLFLQCGVPDWVFKPVQQWKIKKEEASGLITGLRALTVSYSGDLKESICESMQGKNMVRFETKTVDQLEEEEFPDTWQEQLEFYRIDQPEESFGHEYEDLRLDRGMCDRFDRPTGPGKWDVGGFGICNVLPRCERIHREPPNMVGSREVIE